ncbi:MAG TPA: nuclear transport factor 2 family protein [Actinomycetota bacterium]|jgi:ketosteroid isomerase-like protein|nr:nuclear transport factor 2 family protein [Actinomycetota bacterium]
MTGDRLQRWMAGYVRAWGSNDRDDIAALFTEDARYWTAPHREPWTPREAIVEGWLGRREEPDEWTFRWEPVAETGDLAFVRGWTDYPKEGKRYSNLWVIRFAPDGRAAEFTEWWMEA